MSGTEVTAQQNYQADPNLFHAHVGSGYCLALRLANEQMECRADLEVFSLDQPSARPTDSAGETETAAPVTAASVLTPAELIALLKKNNISQTINFANLYLFCAAAAERTSRKDVLLAQGFVAQPGADGWFEMAVKTTGNQAEFKADTSGKVDLRTLHRFTEIEPGQKLGTVHPPRAGLPGMTAHGLPIPPAKGKPFV